MKIDSYAVKTAAERDYLKIESSTTLIKRRTVNAGTTAKNPQEAEEMTQLELSEAAKKLVEERKQHREKLMKELDTGIVSSTQMPRRFTPTNPTELKVDLLERMLYLLTGKRFSGKSIAFDTDSGNRPSPLSQMSFFGASRPATGNFIETETFSYESESVSFKAQGTINTADGRSINIDISMNMSRQSSSYSYSSVQMQPPKGVDPLVINYGGNAASLTGERFAFDLDVDGKMDLISSLGAGSGFLALDKNGDGKINDGSELFGPQSGSGFDDLRAYDSDGNGWIDENDDIFSDLLIWSKDADGNDQLFSLLELDVGAIYLGDVSTQFSINGEGNESLGTMRSTSFFLKESGGSGTISHIDMML